MSGIAARRRAMKALRSHFDEIADRRLILFGGKGGVGKTTMSLLAAIHLAEDREVTLISTDPASNLSDFHGELPPAVRLETVDAESLWSEFLDRNLDSLLEIGDRGTYLEREELRKFFELSIPGVDELMGWNRIADLVRSSPERTLIVDTAPTGHTLRLLSSSSHWHAMEKVLDAMQDKHREIVSQLTRTSARDAIDEFLDEFGSDNDETEALFRDPARTVFVPVMTAEPWVVDQTIRLVEQLRDTGLDITFSILNHASSGCSCASCRHRREEERKAERRSPVEVAAAPRACGLFRTITDLEDYLEGKLVGKPRSNPEEEPGLQQGIGAPGHRLLFVVGKGGVGKTTVASALAISSAAAGESVTLLSIDPAHSVDDVFRSIGESSLSVETIDTKSWWRQLQEEVGSSISKAIAGLTPRGFQNVHDEAITRQLLEMAPPGADEIFALIRILELHKDESVDRIIVDTAPTGHFLRLLELPGVAGAWVRELMRITLRYKDLLASTTLGQKLLDASRSLRSFEALLREDGTAAIIVTRPEPIVITETERLLDEIGSRGLQVSRIVINAVTPENDCNCDRRRRGDEIEEIARFGDERLTLIERRPHPPVTREDLLELVEPG